MVVAASESLTDADVVVAVVDIAKQITKRDTDMINDIVLRTSRNEAQPLLCLNKVDLIRKNKEFYTSKHDAYVDIFETACYKNGMLPHEGLDATVFPWVYLTSALQNEGIDSLRQTLLKLAVPRLW